MIAEIYQTIIKAINKIIYGILNFLINIYIQNYYLIVISSALFLILMTIVISYIVWKNRHEYLRRGMYI